jgi:hypothetical protein
MPVQYWIDSDRHLFCQSWDGYVTLSDVVEFQARVRVSRLRTLNAFVDVSQITGSELAPDQLAVLARELVHPIRMAIVANPARFKIARLFEIFCRLAGSPASIRIFKSKEEALAWLCAGSTSALDVAGRG